MKREIEFRGKRPNSGKWIEGYLFEKDGFSWILSDKFQTPECSCEVLSDSVGQFTGLTDNNEVKIFEGDIVSLKTNFLKNAKNEELTDFTEHIYAISFFDGMFALARGLPFNNGFVSDGIIEVIGNIHDNPELI